MRKYRRWLGGGEIIMGDTWHTGPARHPDYWLRAEGTLERKGKGRRKAGSIIYVPLKLLVIS